MVFGNFINIIEESSESIGTTKDLNFILAGANASVFSKLNSC
jgi:hypothetical protein